MTEESGMDVRGRVRKYGVVVITSLGTASLLLSNAAAFESATHCH